MLIELAMRETFYPAAIEGDSFVTGMSMVIIRLSDGYYYDFDDDTFKNSAWTTRAQALAEVDASYGDGLWGWTTGWVVPESDALAQYQVMYLDNAGASYEGPRIHVLPMIKGKAIAGTLSTTQMSTDLTEATNDHYVGRIIHWTSGVLIGQATDITAYNGTTKVLTYTAVTEAPSANDTFFIV